ncbi:hypothetical protein [Streptomyces beijiangensis]|uniref:DUF4177 domain-containing protein n=1 Tax=Streptomyces beijiangensis TaxID=163361 RepID=A0A939FGD7_9ACTN|nr:hypothetical protein [Streptomyces beijiangensis]MBO0516615.1 hypothetical protein [Streptomyces beijiangensis]
MMTLWEYGELRLRWRQNGVWTGPRGQGAEVDPEAVVAFLNRLGSEGWEAVAMTHTDPGKYGPTRTYLMKRQQVT